MTSTITSVMNHGFVPVATASPLTRVADPHANAALIYQDIQRAVEAGAKVIVFPEVAMTSYIADDMLYHSIVLEAAEQALADLVKRTADLDVVFSVGIPLCINGKIYNTVAVCHAGKIMGVVPKSYIPTYGVDFEGRWFHPGPQEVTPITVAGQGDVPFGSHQVFRCRQMPQLVLGYEICEDIWSPNPPSIELALAGATIICNGSASNASLEKDMYRRGLISGQSARLLACYAYCSSGQGDSTGDVTVGGQEIIAENGSILAQAQPFGEGFAIADVDVESLWGARRGMSSFVTAPTPQAAGYHETVFDMTIPEHDLMRPVSQQPFIPSDTQTRADTCALAVQMQAHGLQARVRAQNADHVVIDGTTLSAPNIALAMLAAEELYKIDESASPEMYVALSAHRDTDDNLVRKLAQALGLPLATFTANADEPTETGDPVKPTLNLQSLLTDPSWVIVNPTDMTQLALGLSEFPFDMARQYGINSQIAHTFIPVILTEFADHVEDPAIAKTLRNIVEQANDDLAPEHAANARELGPAVVQDFYLDGFLRAQYRPAKAFALARQAFGAQHSNRELLTWMNSFYAQFFDSQFLRHSLPDGPRIGSAGLDLKDGFMMPNYMEPTLWINEVNALFDEYDK